MTALTGGVVGDASFRAQVAAPFARKQVRWRPERMNEDGTEALALAYLDARDIMDRLDEVCGVDWSCSYHFAPDGKTICDIGIRFQPDTWIHRQDGAGDTQYEADKGALSDAFKRAAVKWGVGRYLYSFTAIWVPCESTSVQGRLKFVRFTESPWNWVEPREPLPLATHAVAARAMLRQQAAPQPMEDAFEPAGWALDDPAFRTRPSNPPQGGLRPLGDVIGSQEWGHGTPPARSGYEQSAEDMEIEKEYGKW